MRQKLSIIIPCYNSEKTIDEAVSSAVAQDLDIPFEIVIVDDGSTDDTVAIIKNLAKENSIIRCILHAKNLGGGAARNTAVGNSNGNLIFCLDSDDVLTKDMLSKLVAFQIEKQCDGVGISTSKKFNHPDTCNLKYVTNFDYVGETIPFESLLDGTVCSLYSTFLITREAFHKIGGYPIEHGFDTQGMAFRFLCNGLTAYVCPGTIYLHRVNQHESYYLREQNDGQINRNWFFIFEEFLYLFNEKIQKIILEYDLDSNRNFFTENLCDLISRENDIYVENYKELIASGKSKVLNQSGLNPEALILFCKGNHQKDRKKYDLALSSYQDALKLGFSYLIIYYRLFETYQLTIGIDSSINNTIENINKQFLSKKIKNIHLFKELTGRIKRKIYLKIRKIFYNRIFFCMKKNQ